MSNPLLDLITQGESGTAGYNAYNRGTYVDSHGKAHIRSAREPIDFSQMTLGQVLDRQHAAQDSPDKLLAVGRYQIIPSTMSEAAKQLHLDRDQAFTPALQDRIFSQYLIVNKRPEVHDYITGRPGATLREAQLGLACEWASFGDPDKGGASHYPPPNHASITLTQSEQALNQMRTDYQARIAQGMAPAAAWNAATAGYGTRLQANARAVDHRAGASTHAQPLLAHGAQGAAVHKLQSDLGRLGYTDSKGRLLRADGDFGTNTLYAVEAFQRDHQLTVDGKVGRLTQGALDQALNTQATSQTNGHGAVPLSDPRNPSNALYQQALAGVQKIDADMGRSSDQLSRNLAGALAAEAKTQGLTRIDSVAISEDGSRTFAAQSSNGIKQYADVVTAQAVQTPIEKSSAAALAAPISSPGLRQNQNLTRQMTGAPTETVNQPRVA